MQKEWLILFLGGGRKGASLLSKALYVDWGKREISLSHGNETEKGTASDLGVALIFI